LSEFGRQTAAKFKEWKSIEFEDDEHKRLKVFYMQELITVVFLLSLRVSTRAGPF